MDAALDPLADGAARRCGAIRTRAVAQTTTLLLLRFRHHIISQRDGEEVPLLAESCLAVGFRGRPDAPQWLDAGEADRLLQAQPDANISPEQATQFVARILESLLSLQGAFDDIARSQGDEILAAHERVRSAAKLPGAHSEVRPQLPPDVLGIYVLLPAQT
jgi:hypothetical protein